MRKMSRKYIRSYCKDGLATNITNYSFDQINELDKRERLECIGISRGQYGMNGALFLGKSGELYGITGRTLALFQLI